MWSVNRRLMIRLHLLSCILISLTGFIAVLSPSITASLAGLVLALAFDITDLKYSMIGLSRTLLQLVCNKVSLARL
ncbi:hypothetical protein EV401DRAFT_1980418 [Pisolithus croceorrhizus]|nr:hypothetical protein EV401DRAFT_1980418 [Pisolithus croceorrhizus]